MREVDMYEERLNYLDSTQMALAATKKTSIEGWTLYARGYGGCQVLPPQGELREERLRPLRYGMSDQLKASCEASGDWTIRFYDMKYITLTELRKIAPLSVSRELTKLAKSVGLTAVDKKYINLHYEVIEDLSLHA